MGPATACRTRPAPSVDDRVAFCDALVAAGLPVVEVGAFVSPKWVPQMAGSAEVLRRVARAGGRAPTRPRPEPARASSGAGGGRPEVAVFTAASETFNRKNINASIDESFARFAEFVPEARREGTARARLCLHLLRLPVRRRGGSREGRRGGAPPAGRRLRRGLDRRHHRRGASPRRCTRSLGRLKDAIPVGALAVHFHDTRGTALANVLAALEEGIAVVDSSAGGLGGCPYAPGASGNLATEDLALHAPRHGDRDRRGPRGGGAGVPRALAARLGQAIAASRYLPGRPRLTPARAITCRPLSERDRSSLLVVDDNAANRDLLSRRLER